MDDRNHSQNSDATRHRTVALQPADEFLTVPEIDFSKIAFFSSHGGSSTRGVINACGKELRASPAIIISNNPSSQILQFAESRGIDHEVINQARFGTDEAVQKRILEVLSERCVDLIILSGYMKKLGADVIARYPGRIFNIHPALLPKYGGKGMYGMHVHTAVINAGESETGITIHQVNEHYDEGAIVSRLRIPVNPDDTPEALAERIKSEEPPFLVRTLSEMQRRAWKKQGESPP
jgi:phosphoribosylglycinamide formyltransferase-1